MTLFAALTIYLPHEKITQPEIYFGPPVSEASVQQEFFQDASFAIQELNGVRIIDQETGKPTYYFEYIANKQDTLRRISALPFRRDNRKSSLSCELMNASINPLENSELTDEERSIASFFWEAEAEEFTFYECYKSPVKHTLLLSKNSDRILHKVEFV